jgi:hypothetical protein
MKVSFCACVKGAYSFAAALHYASAVKKSVELLNLFSF